MTACSAKTPTSTVTRSVCGRDSGPERVVTFTATGRDLYADPNFHGSDSFTYTVSDGTRTDTATVAMTVTPVNDAPVATDDSATTWKTPPRRWRSDQ